MKSGSSIPNGTIRDHGGGVDAAVARFGGTRSDWMDLSTGINPDPYDIGPLVASDWTALPDKDAVSALENAARDFWTVPEKAAIVAAPGASSLIARIPALGPAGRVAIAHPTYNEHAASFRQNGWSVEATGPTEARVLVHPNNPDGRYWTEADADAALTVIDESFCDLTPEDSLIHLAERPGCLVLKSFGKFWGLAGLRLGFAIGDPDLVQGLTEMLGPWPVSGPALRIGARALCDHQWAASTRARLKQDADRLDRLCLAAGATLAGGTSLFRLYRVSDALDWQTRLARSHIWTRTFPYSDHLIRFGLPPGHGWTRLEQAL